MSCRVDASANLIDIGSNTADSGSKLFLLGVVYLNDVAVNQHFPRVCAKVLRSDLLHLTRNEAFFILRDSKAEYDWSGPVCHRCSVPSQR